VSGPQGPMSAASEEPLVFTPPWPGCAGETFLGRINASLETSTPLCRFHSRVSPCPWECPGHASPIRGRSRGVHALQTPSRARQVKLREAAAATAGAEHPNLPRLAVACDLFDKLAATSQVSLPYLSLSLPYLSLSPSVYPRLPEGCVVFLARARLTTQPSLPTRAPRPRLLRAASCCQMHACERPVLLSGPEPGTKITKC
jgi:hypothetical protein